MLRSATYRRMAAWKVHHRPSCARRRPEYYCGEYNAEIVLGKDNYFLSAGGLLMPARKDQSPPDLRYFKHTSK
jgi:hypothetical protein